MPKIHFLSDSLRMNSGFSTVIKNLIIEFQKRGYQCTITGLQDQFLKSWTYGIECYPLYTGYILEEVKYASTLMEVQPDIVFNLFGSDTGNMDRLLEIPFQDGINIKNVIWYCPVDGKGLGSGSYKSLRQFSMNGGNVVAQCKWGYEQMIEAGIKVHDYIYHGYNPKIFKKLDSKNNRSSNTSYTSYCWHGTEVGQVETNPNFLYDNKCFLECNNIKCSRFKREHVGIMLWNYVENNFQYAKFSIDELSEIVNKRYVFGFVGANFGIRKRIERLLKSYSILIGNSKQMTDKTVLWLHTLPISDQGIDLLNIIKKLKIEKNIIFSYGGDKGSGWSEEAMCTLYNIFDCNVSASSGEGFGLSCLESMACGVPQIGTDICSFPELIGTKNERGLLINCELQMIPDGIFRGLVNELKLSDSMKQMYNNNKNSVINEISKQCIEFTKNYTWSNIADEWISMFTKFK